MDRKTTTALVPDTAERVPPLRHGERLTRAEFEQRYAAHEEPRFAELIEGVVHVASPVSNAHAQPHSLLDTWAGTYRIFTPGVAQGNNGTVRLGQQDVLQPDVFLRIEAEHGGQCRVDEDGYITGAPELAAEVSVSSVAVDRGPRLRAYEAAGVCEYLLWDVPNNVLEWFHRREGRFEPLTPGSDGVLRSVVFPGLWLDPAALLRDDGPAVLRVVQAGLASAEHAALVRHLSEGTGPLGGG